VVGNLATEAKYINLSLHYLEQVIVALGEKSRAHIPYRNSMMTSVLRDSLGGNCKTTMIATLNVMQANIDESISTCRFAQRVALIKNEALVNEETDPTAMIAQLKGEVVRLKAELALATGGGSEDQGPLSAVEILRCREMVEQYVEDTTGKATLMLGDMRQIQECFRLMHGARFSTEIHTRGGH
jgi:kinesin family protein 6/9